jgi:hypothetical protein
LLPELLPAIPHTPIPHPGGGIGRSLQGMPPQDPASPTARTPERPDGLMLAAISAGPDDAGKTPAGTTFYRISPLRILLSKASQIISQVLFKYTSTPEGRWKSTQNAIIEILPSGFKRTRFEPVAPHLVPEAMALLHVQFNSLVDNVQDIVH